MIPVPQEMEGFISRCSGLIGFILSHTSNTFQINVTKKRIILLHKKPVFISLEVSAH